MYIGKIYIEAGHNLGDPGAPGYDGRTERDWTIKVKNLLADALTKQSGGKIKLVLDDDRKSLSATISDFRKTISHNDLLLSIHFNSASSNKATGTEVFVDDKASARSRRIAKRVVDTLSTILGLTNRGVKTPSQSARGTLGILKLQGAAVLLEISFINNPDDVAATDKWLHWGLWDLAAVLLEEMRKR